MYTEMYSALQLYEVPRSITKFRVLFCIPFGSVPLCSCTFRSGNQISMGRCKWNCIECKLKALCRWRLMSKYSANLYGSPRRWECCVNTIRWLTVRKFECDEIAMITIHFEFSARFHLSNSNKFFTMEEERICNTIYNSSHVLSCDMTFERNSHQVRTITYTCLASGNNSVATPKIYADAYMFNESTWRAPVLHGIPTSHGGGALLYEGTILNVTDPRASRCN